MTKRNKTDKKDSNEKVEQPEDIAGEQDESKNSEDGNDVDSAEGTEVSAEQNESADSAETRYLRLAADFQNYKKRNEKERFERYSEGKKDFAADLLPVLDNFDRALAQDAAQAADDHDRAVIAGMEMILKQFLDVLAKNDVKEIPALGEDFDPTVHNAVLMEPSDEYESQKVSEVLQKGYMLGDKVIRTATVKVAE